MAQLPPVKTEYRDKTIEKLTNHFFLEGWDVICERIDMTIELLRDQMESAELETVGSIRNRIKDLRSIKSMPDEVIEERKAGIV